MNNYKTTSVRLIILVIGVFVVLFASYGFKIFAQSPPPGTSVTLTVPGLDDTQYGAFEVTIRFEEAVDGFTESDIAVTNGRVRDGSLTTNDSATYTVIIIPDNDFVGNLSMEISQGVATLVSDNSITVPNTSQSTMVTVDTDIDIGNIGSAAIVYTTSTDIELPLKWDTSADEILSQPWGIGEASLIAVDYAVFYDRDELNYAIAADTTAVPPVTEVLKDIEYKKPGSTTTETIADVDYSVEKSLDLGTGNFVINEPTNVAVESANDIYVGDHSTGICSELASETGVNINSKYDSCFVVRILRTPNPQVVDAQLALPEDLIEVAGEKGNFGTLLLTPNSGVSGDINVVPVVRVRTGASEENDNGLKSVISSTYTFQQSGLICSRTEQVRDAITTEAGVSVCENVTAAHLAAITGLTITGDDNLTALSSGDFGGLTSLETLDLSDNALASLPDDIFEPIASSITTLNLSDNNLTQITSDVLDDLTGLTSLDLSENRITETPDFTGITGLTSLLLNDNRLTEAPNVIGLALTNLQLGENTGAPFKYYVSLERTDASGDFSAIGSPANSADVELVFEKGAPITGDFEFRATDGGTVASSLGVDAGSDKSSEFAVTQTAGSGTTVTITPPTVPTANGFIIALKGGTSFRFFKNITVSEASFAPTITFDPTAPNTRAPVTVTIANLGTITDGGITVRYKFVDATADCSSTNYGIGGTEITTSSFVGTIPGSDIPNARGGEYICIELDAGEYEPRYQASGEIVTVTAPDVPTGITTSDDPGTVFLGVSWTAPASNGPTVGYEIQYCDVSDCDDDDWLPSMPISTDKSTTSTTITITSPGTYKARVRSSNGDNENNEKSPWVESDAAGTAIIPLDFDEDGSFGLGTDALFLYVDQATGAGFSALQLSRFMRLTTPLSTADVNRMRSNTGVFIADTTTYPNDTKVIADFNESGSFGLGTDALFLYVDQATGAGFSALQLSRFMRLTTPLSTADVNTMRTNVNNLLP